MLFSQHLQVTDKRTCWHGNAGGGLSADPKNVVSTVTTSKLLSFHIELIELEFTYSINYQRCADPMFGSGIGYDMVTFL